MITVGITGGIGSGKSTIANFYEIAGYPVYYADVRSKWLLNNDIEVRNQLIANFGEEIYPEYLDRQALANIVFTDSEALKKLNAISHPAIEKDFKKWRSAQNTPIIFKEAAILFESGSYKNVDKTICVTAPEITRIKRVIQRDQTTAIQVQERMNNQWSDEDKIALSDYVITADDIKLVIPQALEILNNLIEQVNL